MKEGAKDKAMLRLLNPKAVPTARYNGKKIEERCLRNANAECRVEAE